MLVPQRATLRWKEWIPLVSQQQRLRNLLEVYAYNLPWSPGYSFYFTLHHTSMSPPFYTSEHVNHQHPRWKEMEFTAHDSNVNTSATGVVIRLWRHQKGLSVDQIALVWGLHFSGLVYLGPSLNATPIQFNENTIVLHLQGGFFTDRSSIRDLSENSLVRTMSVMLLPHEIKPSYSVSLLLRLRNTQQAIKKKTQQSEALREKILAGGVSASDSSRARESNPTIRKLLNRDRPKPQTKQETLAVRCQLEVLRFRVALLRQEKLRKVAQIESLLKQRDLAAFENSDRSCALTVSYQALHKKTEQLKESRRQFADMREVFLLKSAQLCFRRKQLMSQLSLIYPVVQASGKYTICGVHLPNSEDLSPDDASVSVALGFVAHLVQMVSIFLQVPLRYPILHFGSRSKIIDYISDKIPDKEREFPLFSRGKDRLQFHYGVFLLNKDIAQLRWLVGFPTNDLRATLHNVYHLLHLNQFPTLDRHRSMSGSSLDVVGSSTNVSPVGSMLATQSSSHCDFVSTSLSQVHLRSRSSKSVGSSEALFHSSKRTDLFSGSPSTHNIAADSIASSSNLSCSLDTGLDEYEEAIKVDISSNNSISTCPQMVHVGSEPNLAIHSHHNNTPSSSDALFSKARPVIQPLPENEQAWTESALAYSASDSDIFYPKIFEESVDHHRKSEFTIVTERIAELVDSCVEIGEKQASSHPCNLDSHSCHVDSCSISSVGTLANNVQEGVQMETTRLISEDITQSSYDNVIAGSVESFSIEYNRDYKQTDILPASLDDADVDIGTDALIDMPTSKLIPVTEKNIVASAEGRFGLLANIPSTSHSNFDRRVGSEENGMECVGVEERVLVDNLFANVTSRTEALASSTTSFNLMSSRHGNN